MDTFVQERLDSLHEIDFKIVELLASLSTLFETYSSPNKHTDDNVKPLVEQQTRTIYGTLSKVAIDLRKEVKIVDDNIGVYDKNRDGIMILPISVDQKNTTLGRSKLKEELTELHKLIPVVDIPQETEPSVKQEKENENKETSNTEESNTESNAEVIPQESNKETPQEESKTEDAKQEDTKQKDTQPPKETEGAINEPDDEIKVEPTEPASELEILDTELVDEPMGDETTKDEPMPEPVAEEPVADVSNDVLMPDAPQDEPTNDINDDDDDDDLFEEVV